MRKNGTLAFIVAILLLGALLFAACSGEESGSELGTNSSQCQQMGTSAHVATVCNFSAHDGSPCVLIIDGAALDLECNWRGPNG
jgi:hypothetical protein